ncbi:unnamed protein product [Gongylonema pulchrum]|uniref:isopentenyl-diphosphate Delta-isomerase n=1 Tax=Gongylonema pulchrum TaxID=637853 RepID=A0A183DQY0_9BILA|nr:unnamed protein product [Gongylonema pulchrum]
MSDLAAFLRQNGQKLFKTATISMQNKYMEEQCIIVDEQDKPLRPGTKRFCHSSETCKQNGQKLFKTATISMQNKYMDEQCIIVNEQDKPLRPGTKRFCHSSETCKMYFFLFFSVTLHRAFSVFLFTSSQNMILQKRSAQKITFPSMWTNACCSHPLWNSYEMSVEEGDIGVRRAAKRKLNHELGIETVDIEKMEVMGRFLYKSIMHNNKWGEHEIDHALVIRDFDVEQLRRNPEEVDEIAIVSPKKLDEMMKSMFFFSFSLIIKLFLRMESLFKNGCEPTGIRTTSLHIRT